MKKENKETISTIKNFLKDHNTEIISKITFTNTTSGKRIGQNGLHFIQLSLRRSKALIEGYLANYRKHPLLGIIAVRTHFETTGALGYFLYNLQKYYSKDISYEQLDNSLHSLSLGFKVIPGKEEHDLKCDPVNVMNMIDKTDKLLKDISPNIVVFRKMYNELSEFCHPNHLGLYLFCDSTGKRTINYSDDIYKETTVFRHHLCISSMFCLTLYDKIYEVLKGNEELPVIVKNNYLTRTIKFLTNQSS